MIYDWKKHISNIWKPLTEFDFANNTCPPNARIDYNFSARTLPGVTLYNESTNIRW